MFVASLLCPRCASAADPNLTVKLAGTVAAPGAAGSAKFTLVSNQPTLQVSATGLNAYAGKTADIQILRGATTIRLARGIITGGGALTVSTRLPATTLRVDDVLQVSYDSKVLDSGKITAAKN